MKKQTILVTGIIALGVTIGLLVSKKEKPRFKKIDNLYFLNNNKKDFNNYSYMCPYKIEVD